MNRLDALYKVFESAVTRAVRNAIYQYLEYNCHTNLTDEDMLKMQIDWALENRDKERFIELTNQLKELTK